jgi:hypothetical protein
MAVPDQARLVVDGTIAKRQAKSNDVVLSLRVRNPKDGATLVSLDATAAGLATIDKAAADLSARLLPAVREQLVKLRGSVAAPKPPPPVLPTPTPEPNTRPMLVALAPASAGDEQLHAALRAHLPAFLARVGRSVQPVEPTKLTRASAASTVKASGTDLAISLRIVGYVVQPGIGKIPLARARIHVLVSDAVGVVLDRVIVTDSVVGDRELSEAALASRVAREVLEIARGHLRRTVAAWR